jgi:hypothetical protein
MRKMIVGSSVPFAPEPRLEVARVQGFAHQPDLVATGSGLRTVIVPLAGRFSRFFLHRQHGQSAWLWS